MRITKANWKEELIVPTNITGDTFAELIGHSMFVEGYADKDHKISINESQFDEFMTIYGNFFTLSYRIILRDTYNSNITVTNHEPFPFTITKPYYPAPPFVITSNSTTGGLYNV